MEMENRTMRMLLQSMPKKGFILTFVIFAILFIICIIIGAVGPHVYDVRSVSAYDCPQGVTVFDPDICDGVDLSQNNTVWTGEIRNLDKLNQELLLIATIHNKLYESAGVEKTLQFTVDMAGRNSDQDQWHILESHNNDVHDRSVSCEEGTELCQNITLAHQVFIKYSTFQFNVTILNAGAFLGDVTFSFVFVDHNYTLFELWFRFSFLIITFVVVIFYAYKLRTFSWVDWTIEQKWAAILLFGLMAYDNPFFPLEILVAGWFPIFLNRVLYASFIVLLLFFWLIMFDGIRKESALRTFTSFYLPKILLLGFFWIAGVTVYTWSQLNQLDDPAFSSRSEMPGYVAFQVIMLILLITYVFWLVYVVCRSCGDSKLLPYLGVRVKFFGVFTLLVMLTVLGGLIFGGIFGAMYNNAAEFTSFIGLFNLYCYTLAFVYLPAAGYTPSRSDRLGMVRLEDDDAFPPVQDSVQDGTLELEDALRTKL